MKLNLMLILYINFLVLASCLEVQLIHYNTNGTTDNYTIINSSNSKNELFKAEKIFLSACQCKYDADVFYLSQSTSTINFTINTSSSQNDLILENHNLYINTNRMKADYSLNRISNNLYYLRIDIFNDKKIENNDVLKYDAIYKKEKYSEYNHPEYNDNKYFFVLNFTFYYNKTLYDFSFIKIVESDEKYKSFITCCCVMLIAFIYLYFSTYMKLKFKFVKEIQEESDIEWYHIIFAVFFGSCILVSIYLFKKYLVLILNLLIGFESWLCVYYTFLFFVLRMGKNVFSKNKNSHLIKYKYEYLLDLNFYEILSLILSLILIIFYFITRHWILNDLICFCLAFTTLSFIVLKSFFLCFVCLFGFFIYDTFWVFYSDKIFAENVMMVAATSIQIPIKIEFPILFSNNPIKNCMLLGLGDILLPGMVIKYCRRFDLLKKKMDKKKINLRKKASKMGFYHYNLLLYFISVSLAMIMMFVFNHGQPVLFYISPIFIFGLMIKAYYDGCFGLFWNGIKLRKNKKNSNNNNDKEKKNISMSNNKNEEEENEEENEEEEDDEDKYSDKYKGKKFVGKKYELNELQQLNLNN